MDAAALVDIAAGVEVELEVGKGFERSTYLNVFVAVASGWCDNTVARQEPSTVYGTAHITIVHESKGEIQARLHTAARTALTEDVAHLREEAWHGQTIFIGIGHADVAHHHGDAAGELESLVPSLVFLATLGANGQFDAGRVLRGNKNTIGINHLEAHRIACAIGADGSHLQLLAALVVLHEGGSVGLELYLAREKFLLLFLLGRGRGHR